MAFIIANKAGIALALLAISEVLAQIPAIKANSIFDVIVGIVKTIAGK